MVKQLLSKTMLLLFALIAGSGSAWAEDKPNWSYTVVNGDASKLNTTAKTFTVDENHVWSYADTEVKKGTPSVTIGSYSSTYGIKFGASSSQYFNPVILSTGAFNDVAITKVSLYLKHNGSKAGSLTVKQGNITIGTATTSQTSNWIIVTCSETNSGAGGTLEIKYEVEQALYINKIEVWYEEMGTKHTLSSEVLPNSAAGTVTLGSTSIVEGKTTDIKAEPAEGYYFVNWTYTGTGASVTSTTDAETTFTMGTSDAIVTANFAEINYWVVTYDYNDGVTANEEVRVLKAEASSYTLKTTPTREGYIFTGWKIGAVSYDAGADYEPTNDVTVQAQWEWDSSALITWKKSGKNDIATGAKYIMVGSNTSNNVTTWKFATAMGTDTYLHASAVGEHGTIDADEAKLFDETPEIFTMNETADGWTMTNADGKKIGLTGDKKLGYNNGDTTWNLGGTDALPTFAATLNNSAYTMYFNWNTGNSRFNAYTSSAPGEAYFYRLDDGKNVYTLTLDFNYGSVADGTHRVLEGADYTLTTPKRTGYVFTGWNTEEDGSGTNYTAGDYTMPAANTTLYAQWSENESVTVTSVGYATYVSDSDLDYSNVSGLKAYKAAVSGTAITFEKVTTVPAGEGVLLQGVGTFSVPAATSAVDAWGADDNAFVRGEDKAVATGEGPYNYILFNGDNGIGFYKANNQIVAKNRAYLQSATSAARIALNFDEATGISTIDHSPLSIDNSVYNLNGQRVVQPSKGLYIVNGKKMILK
ncbi:MAG: InlB B-repeat-containing protein [Prevotella sp.]|nr:InlB B-repeat-containing protein [Prevotella sp.]